ncbi:hypothetical protein ACQKDS_14585 [Serratia sp. NPDC078593]|uniref:hypothetical protein n=1 Tax=unclassified Serratia (in: enterobacteria) TaxID=2647522 RepID=UPI0037D66038
MLNLDHLLKTAPQMPATIGSWMPVYLEPMLGSGERLVIIVAAVTSTGEALVKPAIRKEVIEAMYGFKSSGFTNMVELISTSLSHHLNQNKSFTGWQPPVTGISVGEPRQAASSSATGILRQAVSLSSSLSSLLDDEMLSSKKRTGTTKEKDRWSTQLIDAVIKEDIHREVFFNRQYVFSDGHRPAKIFYLSDYAAINTGKLLPSNLNELVRDGKAKISDLSMIKKNSNLFDRSTHEMVVFRPSDDNPAYSEKKIALINSAFLALQDLAHAYDVSITSVNSIEQAARIILKTAA